MKIGVRLPHISEPSANHLEDFSVRAEHLGFDSLWTNDHILVPEDHFHQYGRMFESLTTLAYVSAITTTIALGTSVLLLPLRDLHLAAKQLATVDHLSRGRLIVGLGVGWLRGEFELLNKDFPIRGEVLDEQIDILRRLWSGAGVNFAGKFYEFKDVFQGPAPYSRSGPPLWIGGSSPKALRRAVKFGLPWLPNHLSPTEIGQSLDEYPEFSRERPDHLAVHIKGTPGAQGPDDPAAQVNELRGTPAQILRTLESYAVVGVGHVIVSLAGDDDPVQALEWLGKYILKEAHEME